MHCHVRFRGGLAAAGLLLAAACAPPTAPSPGPSPAAGLPPIPRVDGPLDIRVVHPTANTPRPGADSSLVYGSVGSGAATLSINGRDVPVEPNGAFLAYLPVPADGTYQLTAQAGGRTATATRSYRAPAAASQGAAAPTTTEFPEPRVGRVTGGADTLRTGSDVAIGRTSPSGSFRWFLPNGARVAVTGQRGDMLRVALDTATAWFPASGISMESGSPPARAAVGGVSVAPAAEWIDLRIAAGGAPFHLHAEGERLLLTLYGRTPPAGETALRDPLLSSLRWEDVGSARAEIRLAQPLWGYKAFYSQEGDLVLRVRRPPSVDAARPLAGIRLVLDPGHPPAGATGPTGLTEAEANLAIALRLAEILRGRGAQVVMTRTTAQPVVSATDQTGELRARAELALRADPHLFVSIHNNAFPEGADPFRSHGTSTYYFHPFASTFARLLNEEIVSTTRIRDLGHRSGNLAMVRPTWFPAALTESLFMPVPQQEAALRDPTFLQRLAEAHATGIERFLRGTAAR